LALAITVLESLGLATKEAKAIQQTREYRQQMFTNYNTAGTLVDEGL